MAEETKSSIVIVEDSPAWQELWKSKFKNKYTVHVFASGEECIENIAQINPKLIFLDFHLEGFMTGKDTLKEIQKLIQGNKITSEPYIIMISSQNNIEVAVEVVKCGAYDYVSKNMEDETFERVKIILRNIEKELELKKQVLEIPIRIRRNNLIWLGAFGVVFLISSIIYLHTCPNARIIKWDPFGYSTEGRCLPANNTK